MRSWFSIVQGSVRDLSHLCDNHFLVAGADVVSVKALGLM